MIRKSGYRFSLATNAERVCAEIMLEQKAGARWRVIGRRASSSLKIPALFRLQPADETKRHGMKPFFSFREGIAKPVLVT